MLNDVLASYGFKEGSVHVAPFGTGLINHTWKVTAFDKAFILQRINQHVFRKPGDIANNISRIAAYLKASDPEYLFVAPVKTISGDEMVYREGEGYFRMFPFVPGSHSIDAVETAAQASEAAKQFGRFTKQLATSNFNDLKITIPDFHNLTLRYRQFALALEDGNQQRISECAGLIQQVKHHSAIVHEYEQIILSPAFKLRVTHHDTKISNVLFDDAGNGLCVIDLDTVMPGYFISDVGDMMRTYLSPVNEEEKDFTKIAVREDFYKAIVQGYYGEMKDELTETEIKYFFYAGKFMIYMQALRFITDHFNDDAYYGVKYPGQNLVRAGNQMVLLQRLMEQQPSSPVGQFCG